MRPEGPKIKTETAKEPGERCKLKTTSTEMLMYCFLWSQVGMRSLRTVLDPV